MPVGSMPYFNPQRCASGSAGRELGRQFRFRDDLLDTAAEERQLVFDRRKSHGTA